MDSSNDSFTISTQQPLLHHHQHQLSPPKHTRINNLRTIIFFNFLILIIIIAISMITPSIFKKPPKPEQVDAYIWGSSQYYCHLTPYPELCHDSMSPIINATALESNPGPMFTSSLRVSISELSNITLSITKSLSSSTNDTHLALSECQKLVHDSLSRLRKSLGLLGVDSDVQSLTYMEMDEIRALATAGAGNMEKCLWALQEIAYDGVEEMKLGVEKANMLIVNSVVLFEGRESILFDFYNPLVGNGDYFEYDSDFYHNFEYRFLACLYSAMYLVLALLYFMFWNSN